MKKVFLLLAGFVLMAATLVSCGGGASTPSDAATKCVELMKAGDYQGLVDQLAFDEGLTDEEIEQSKAMLVGMGKEKSEKELTKKQGIASYQVVSEEISEDGNTAVVKIEITYGDGSTDTEKYDLKLVDGAWKPYIKK